MQIVKHCKQRYHSTLRNYFGTLWLCFQFLSVIWLNTKLSSSMCHVKLHLRFDSYCNFLLELQRLIHVEVLELGEMLSSDGVAADMMLLFSKVQILLFDTLTHFNVFLGPIDQVSSSLPTWTFQTDPHFSWEGQQRMFYVP